MSPSSIGFISSMKTGSGILRFIESSFRLVSLVGGLTAVFIAWFSGSWNQCFGTKMYSILRSCFFFFSLVDLPGTAAFFALRGRDGRSTCSGRGGGKSSWSEAAAELAGLRRC